MELPNDIRRSFEQRRQRPLVLEVRDELERMILSGEVAAGERLNEYQLAEQMGVSRGPVREAARSLESDGLVTAVANQGVFVRQISITDALELYDLRAMIAGYLCARVAETASAATIKELHGFLERMQKAMKRAEDETYFSLNLDFHDHIAAASGMNRATALYVGLGKEVRLFRQRVLRGQQSLAVSNSEHESIVAAIEAGDAETARVTGAQHHLRGKQRLLDSLQGR